MRTIKIALGLALASIFAVIGLTAPASAQTTVFYKSFGFLEACNNVGFGGVTNHQWIAYYCDTVSPGVPNMSPGVYNLYVTYN
jgi:hypothetical protein